LTDGHKLPAEIVAGGISLQKHERERRRLAAASDPFFDEDFFISPAGSPAWRIRHHDFPLPLWNLCFFCCILYCSEADFPVKRRSVDNNDINIKWIGRNRHEYERYGFREGDRDLPRRHLIHPG
jgi:hypothetical protein